MLQIVEYKITYDGENVKDENCKIQTNNEKKMCTVSSFLFTFFLIPQITFSVDKEMKAPIHLYYELNNFYQVSFNVILHNQNHRLYVNSRDDNQLRGEEVDISTLQTNCGNKTYDGELILNPCGSIANSFFNDVYHLKSDDYVLNEHDIAWKYDRDKYSNPSEYDETKYKYLQFFVSYHHYRYQSYPDIIPKDKVDDITSASYYGGGVQNEHFIVWMRVAALPRFRKLYGRIEKDIPAGTKLEVEIEASRIGRLI